MENFSLTNNRRQKLAARLSEFVTNELAEAFQEKQDKKAASECERGLKKRLQNTIRQIAITTVQQGDILQDIMPEASEVERAHIKDRIDSYLPHLSSLLWRPVEIPSCTSFRKISRVHRAITAATGALYGGLLGWLLLAPFFQDGLSGMLFGAALGSGAIFYLMESYCLSVFLKILSAPTFLLSFKNLFSRNPFLFLTPEKKCLSALLWLFLFLFPWLTYPAGAFDRQFCLQWMRRQFDYWAVSVECVISLYCTPETSGP